MMWAETLFGNSTCRLCASTEESCIPLFSKEGNSLLHKIKRCLPISVSEHDEKPKQVCYSCLSKLDITYCFIEDSIAAELRFNSIIQSSYDSSSLQDGKVVIIEGDGKSGSLDHELNPLIGLRTSADNMWQTVKSEGNAVIQHQHNHDVIQERDATVVMESNQASATVTVEHVALHTEPLTSDRVIVLSKVEARDDGNSPEILGSCGTGNEEGTVSDILLMVELKYKDVLGEGTSKVPTIAYATSEHPATLSHFKTSETEHQVIELIPQQTRVLHTIVSKNEDKIEISKQKQKQKQQSNKKFECNVCHKYFVRRNNLNLHLAVHANQRPFACDICLKTFCSRWALTLHKRLHSKQFSCDLCDKVFSVKGKLERHRRVHTGEKPFACPHCPKAFSDKRNMHAHLRCHTGEKPYSCDLCGKKFRSKSHLTDHNRVHTVEKPYICHICGKNFKWKTTLNMHLKFHSGEQYSCDLCGKKFSRRADVKKHVLSHTVERPYACKICNKQFKDNNTLRKHSRSHSAEKPFSCYRCGKSFRFPWYLTNHMKIHEPVQCTTCGTTFETRAPYLAHKKNQCIVVSTLYKCKYCNDQFEAEEQVVQHMNEFHANS